MQSPLLRSALLLLALGPAISNAGVALETINIGFEGVAPPGGATSEDNTHRVFGGFDVFEPHGNYVDSAFPDQTEFPHNGTDWLLVNCTCPMIITHTQNAAFSLLRFDATEYDYVHDGSSPLVIEGTFAIGGTITASFVTAPRSQHTTPQFQTFTLPSGWDGLSSVKISAPLRGFATDNVVVAVPEPSAAVLTICGILFVVGSRKSRSSFRR